MHVPPPTKSVKLQLRITSHKECGLISKHPSLLLLFDNYPTMSFWNKDFIPPLCPPSNESSTFFFWWIPECLHARASLEIPRFAELGTSEWHLSAEAPLSCGQAVGCHLCSLSPCPGTRELAWDEKSDGMGGLGWRETEERHQEEQLERSQDQQESG